jgi:hypothetical protein
VVVISRGVVGWLAECTVECRTDVTSHTFLFVLQTFLHVKLSHQSFSSTHPRQSSSSSSISRHLRHPLHPQFSPTLTKLRVLLTRSSRHYYNPLIPTSYEIKFSSIPLGLSPISHFSFSLRPFLFNVFLSTYLPTYLLPTHLKWANGEQVLVRLLIISFVLCSNAPESR